MTLPKVYTDGEWIEFDNTNYDSRYILQSTKGENSGICPLDESGHVFATNLPSSITGAVSYQGTFDPSLGESPTPSAQGYYYVASASGTVDTTEFSTGDWLVYTDDTEWDKINNSSSSVTWANISDKPPTFTPSSHGNESHDVAFITSTGVTYENLNANGDVGSNAGQVADGQHAHTGVYQPLDSDLTAIAALTSNGFIKRTGSGTAVIDTNTYVTITGTAADSTLWDSLALPTLAGNALKYLRLNSGGSAFEFASVEGGASSFTSLTDTPANYIDASLKYVRVNAAGNALEFATVYTGESLDIHNTSSTSEFSTGDEVLIYDSSLGENRKILRGNFFNGLEGDYISIHGAVEETTPATNMELLVYDPSVPANRRMTRANFLDGISAVGAFTDLTDTPASYEGYDETYYVRVNAASNALEFATVPSSYTLPTASADTLGGVKIGSGITITDGIISASGGGGGITWNEVTGTSQTAAADNGYIANNSSLVTITLPATCAIGKTIRVAGKGAGMWKVAQNAGQTIYFGDQNSTSGTAGYIAARYQYDAVELLCIIANTTFLVIGNVGNLDVI